MHEWLEALRKSAKATSEGVLAEEVRRAETECGVPFPGELTDLYLTLNGGDFEGEVRLYPLRGDEGAPSVLEKSRLMLVGLPAAGVWRFGLKGPHRHLFVARKSAMEEQGDGGGPLPGWVETLEGDDWVFGTWENEKKEMRLYRTLKEMLEVLVPPVEVESFGERTFARALNAVLQGALSGAAAEEDEDAPATERNRDYSRDLAALAREVEEAEEADEDDEDEVSDVGEEAGSSGAEVDETEASDEDSESEDASEAEEGGQEELFTEPEPARPAAKKVRSARSREEAAPPDVNTGKAAAKKATGKAATKKAAPARGAAKKAVATKPAAKKPAAKKAAPAAKKAAAKKAPGKAAAKKSATPKRGGTAAKKGAAAKRSTAKKGAAPKRGAPAAKKSAAKKTPGRPAGARKATAKKSARRRS